MIVGDRGWFWVIVGDCGWLWVIVVIVGGCLGDYG